MNKASEVSRTAERTASDYSLHTCSHTSYDYNCWYANTGSRTRRFSTTIYYWSSQLNTPESVQSTPILKTFLPKIDLGVILSSPSRSCKRMFPVRCLEILNASGARVSAGAGNFSFHHRVQTGSGTHPASYPMGSRGSFPGGKAAGSSSWPFTTILCRGKESVELYLHSPNTPSWCGAQLRKARGQLCFTLLYYFCPIQATFPAHPSLLYFTTLNNTGSSV
jgi:hypothetical protein